MKLTNNKNLPEVIVNAIEKLTFPPHPDANRIRVTALIAPPIIFQLKRRHWDEIEEDASESVWRLLGTAIHKVIESVSDNKTSEQKAEKDFNGITISGKIDTVNGSEVCDYKITSVWHKVFADGIPEEWARQLNVYAYLLKGIKTAKVIVIYRDWSKSKARQDADYPQEALAAYPITLASEDTQRKYIEERIKLHKEAMGLADDDLPICSPEERWATETTWAIYKNANKTATRVLKNKEEAEKLIEAMAKGKKDEYRIEERKGEDKRCLQYCPVVSWCPYGKKLIKGVN